MKRSRNNLLWLIAACMIFLQAVAPSMALAQVSMRCRGMKAGSICFKAVVPTEAAAARVAACMQMPCCRHRMVTPAMCRGALLAAPVTARVISDSTCVLVVKAIACVAPASTVTAYRLHVDAPPSTGPPASGAVRIADPSLRSVFAHVNSPILSSVRPNSHGLRAPPVA